MVSGALVVIVWIAWIKPLAHINEIFGLYEIIPGFIVSVIVTYVNSVDRLYNIILTRISEDVSFENFIDIINKLLEHKILILVEDKKILEGYIFRYSSQEYII